MAANRGLEVHAEKTSTDAHSGVVVPLFEAGGPTLTLGSTEMLCITDITLVAAVGGDVKVEMFNAARTLTLFRGTIAANSGIVNNFETPFVGPRGGTLRLTAPAGQVDIQCEGYIIH